MDTVQLKEQAKQFISVVEQIESQNRASEMAREQLIATINTLMENNKSNREALDIATHAIELLTKVSDEAVGEAYGFLTESLNTALSRMFKNTTRRIELKERMRNNQYPQLDVILHVGNGKTRSLKGNSGHGLAEIVSLLSILSLIVITGSRRILVMDEIISGVDIENRQIIDDILWTFVQIGFQFIINDHGFVPKGSHVYYLEMVGDVSGVKQDYIATNGVYLQGDSGYTEDKSTEEILEDIVEQSKVESNTSGVLGSSNAGLTRVEQEDQNTGEIPANGILTM